MKLREIFAAATVKKHFIKFIADDETGESDDLFLW